MITERRVRSRFHIFFADFFFHLLWEAVDFTLHKAKRNIQNITSKSISYATLINKILFLFICWINVCSTTKKILTKIIVNEKQFYTLVWLVLCTWFLLTRHVQRRNAYTHSSLTIFNCIEASGTEFYLMEWLTYLYWHSKFSSWWLRNLSAKWNVRHVSTVTYTIQH